MPIPEGTEKKKSRVYVEKDAGYIQILPEIFCESEIKTDSLYPVSSNALARWKDGLDEITQPFSGATATANGAVGLVPASTPADRNSFLRGDGLWAQVEITDNQVKSVASNTRLFYVSGSGSIATNTGFQYFDTNVYVSENPGELHAKKLVGDVQGNVTGNLAGTASNAIADANGNQLTTHYATKEEMGHMANEVHTHSTSDITTLRGYTKGASGSAIAENDTLNSALGKIEVKLGKSAPLSSPALTGLPTTPTPTNASSNKQIANKEYVDNAISALIGGAGSAMDTLGEIAAALNNNSNFASAMTNALGNKVDANSANYVKSLSVSDVAGGQNLSVQFGNNSTTVLFIKDTTYTASNANPKANGTAASGTSSKYSREDHVHPLQTTITGNAATATTATKANQLTTARKLRTNLASTADATFNGTADQLNIPVTGVLPVANGGTGANNLNGLVQTGPVAQTIQGTKTFSNTIVGGVTGNAGSANTAGKAEGTPAGTTWVAGATSGKALVNSNATTYGAILNASTKNYKVAMSTYPSNTDLVYLYSVTNANVSSATNTVAKQLTWNAADGTLTANAFSGTFTGTLNGASTSCTGNAATATKATQDRNGLQIDTNYLKLSGGTVTGTLNLTRTTDAGGTSTNVPALRIGNVSGEHLEFDGNEIMCKATGNTVGKLYINNDGGLVTIGSGGLTVGGTITGNLKGNVTGNCSGSSGSCTGNAASATKLQTKRTINGVGFDGTANITVADSTKLPLSGGTVTGTLILSRTTDLDLAKDNAPALIIGGTRSQAHIEIDNNEIAAKANATTGGALYLLGTSTCAVTPAAGDSSTKIATTKWVHNLFHFSTSAPSNSTGANGDLWYQYV